LACVFAFAISVAFACGIAPPNFGVGNEQIAKRKGGPVDSGLEFDEEHFLIDGALDGALPDSAP
jgi:hypothetical protein